MAEGMSIAKRLALLQIDDDTKANVTLFRPTLIAKIDTVTDNFYRFLGGFPDARRIITSQEMVPILKKAQHTHWLRLFSCRFDDAFVESAMGVGRAHLRVGVAPYLYIAGYNFFLTQLTRIAAEQYANRMELPGVLTGVQKLVMLDMEIALSVYTREFWLAQAHAAQ